MCVPEFYRGGMRKQCGFGQRTNEKFGIRRTRNSGKKHTNVHCDKLTLNFLPRCSTSDHPNLDLLTTFTIYSPCMWSYTKLNFLFIIFFSSGLDIWFPQDLRLVIEMATCFLPPSLRYASTRKEPLDRNSTIPVSKHSWLGWHDGNPNSHSFFGRSEEGKWRKLVLGPKIGQVHCHVRRHAARRP